MREILADLVAEQQYLDQSLQRSPDRDWKAKTPVAGWSVKDTIAHLAWSEERAASALQGDLDFLEEAKEYEDLDAYIAAGVEEARTKRPQEIIEWWRHGRADVVDALSRASRDDRVTWFLGDMSVVTFASARLMETWAHGLDILTTLDKEIEDTPRLRHVAHLGWATLPHAFALAGEDYPSPIRVELVGPGYARWVFGPEDAENIVRGNAADWCRVVVRRMDPEDAENLTATGPVAETALRVARAHL
ncbi:MAG: maleylpyruvate isomerase family mycothiol-dependent enzyme [Acidimicrobiia bacterium]|nr:maleylpyruvate isomerase family mycothiol-dependent enzyme [Acidimicrobiia bacterium]